MAPPPPPDIFIPPPPEFMGDLDSQNVEKRPHPSMPALRPFPLPSMGEEDLSSLKPPPVPPPKPPSICSSGSTSPLPISSPPPHNVPERPKFAPPPPPPEKQSKMKTPPPKPMRLSSIPSLDSPPLTPVPSPPVQTSTPSTFNPQNEAKLYSIPKTSILKGNEDRHIRPKQILLLEDSSSLKSAPVLAQVDGKAPKIVIPAKPDSKEVQEPKDNINITKLTPSPLPEANNEAKSDKMETDPSLQTPALMSPQLHTVNNPWVNSESVKDRLKGSLSQTHRFCPLLDHKLRNLKSSETHASTHVASPFALLMAAKEREKHRSGQCLQENGPTTNNHQSASIHQSDLRPNTFIITPNAGSSSHLTSKDLTQKSAKFGHTAKPTQTLPTPQISSSALVKGQMKPTSLNRSADSSSVISPVKRNAQQSPPKSQLTQEEDTKEEFTIPLLPPPPEFDDLDEMMAPPPDIPPPDPPFKKIPTGNVSFSPLAQKPSPFPKPKPQEAPKPLPPEPRVKPKPQVQTNPKADSPQLPCTVSSSQATLLSILQKKMLEMDKKMAPVKDADSTLDDWGSPLSDEDNNVPAVGAAQQSNDNHTVNKAATLNTRMLEGKMAKKYKEAPSLR